MKLSSEGLSGALDSLIATCAPSKNPTPSQTVVSRDRAENDLKLAFSHQFMQLMRRMMIIHATASNGLI